MKRILGMLLGVGAVFLLMVAPAQAAMSVIVARMLGGQVQVVGIHAAKQAAISWQGTEVATSTAGGTFFFRNGAVPPTCVGELSDGVETAYIPVQNCVPTVVPSEFSSLLATGQTTASKADKNDGIVGAVSVPDDGTLKLGLALRYHDNGDGTVTDLNTGLMWEMKCNFPCSGSSELHDVDYYYRWTGDGSQETIWDWLAEVNTEGGTGYAGHSDWRIPNVRELESIVDFGRSFDPAIDPTPVIDPTFDPTQPDYYWSSTTYAVPTVAYYVDFYGGFVGALNKTSNTFVRAVRGGP